MQVDKTALPSKNGVFAAPDKVGSLIFIGGGEKSPRMPKPKDKKELYMKHGSSSVPFDKILPPYAEPSSPLNSYGGGSTPMYE